MGLRLEWAMGEMAICGKNWARERQIEAGIFIDKE
jgi:hypothetical protein